MPPISLNPYHQILRCISRHVAKGLQKHWPRARQRTKQMPETYPSPPPAPPLCTVAAPRALRAHGDQALVQLAQLRDAPRPPATCAHADPGATGGDNKDGAAHH